MQFTNVKTHILNSLINGVLELFGNKKKQPNNNSNNKNHIIHLKKKYQNYKKYI